MSVLVDASPDVQAACVFSLLQLVMVSSRVLTLGNTPPSLSRWPFLVWSGDSFWSERWDPLLRGRL